MDRKVKAPAHANEPETVVSKARTLEQTTSTQSIAKISGHVYGRSENHPTFYRVGTWNESPVYWHPIIGYAVETAYGLRGLLDEALSEVSWFDEGVYYEIVKAVEQSYGLLRRAMDERLLAEIDRLRRDEAFAKECEQEKRLAFEEANRSLANQRFGDSNG